MKRFVLGVMLVGGAAALSGCPVYPDNRSDGCESPSDCDYGYACNSQGQCVAAACNDIYDCPDGYGCTSQGQCVPITEVDASTGGACGACPVGTVCTLIDRTLQCLPEGTATSDGGSFTDGTAPGDAAPTVDATPDGSADAGTPAALCNADTQCAATPGSKCIDGLCAVQGQLCSDGTQCIAAGESCVDGVCLPPCGVGAPPCPTGYACDFNRDVCSVNPSACTSSGDCQGGAVCVDARCVAPCAAADAGPQCATGQVCVNGGCIPDQQARFTCQNDGNAGSLANSCDPSSICLHGDCYAACDGEGGGCADSTESCKSVTISKGTYAVCATPSTLGSECNPAVGSYCAAPDVCVNGYCK